MNRAQRRTLKFRRNMAMMINDRSTYLAANVAPKGSDIDTKMVVPWRGFAKMKEAARAS